MQPGTQHADTARTMTIEAFADTIIPGEKRWPDDRAIAGVSSGGGAVASGAVDLLHEPGAGMTEMLDFLVPALNDHARAYADQTGVLLDADVPAFVALSYPDRAALVRILTAEGHPEKAFWVAFALFSNMAFDSAAHLNTADAMAAGHPGLLTIGYFRSDADGIFRFPSYSYGRALANLHPHTTASGSPR